MGSIFGHRIYYIVVGVPRSQRHIPPAKSNASNPTGCDSLFAVIPSSLYAIMMAIMTISDFILHFSLSCGDFATSILQCAVSKV